MGVPHGAWRAMVRAGPWCVPGHGACRAMVRAGPSPPARRKQGTRRDSEKLFGWLGPGPPARRTRRCGTRTAPPASPARVVVLAGGRAGRAGSRRGTGACSSGRRRSRGPPRAAASRRTVIRAGRRGVPVGLPQSRHVRGGVTRSPLGRIGLGRWGRGRHGLRAAGTRAPAPRAAAPRTLGLCAARGQLCGSACTPPRSPPRSPTATVR
jgi:hypothetical protein